MISKGLGAATITTYTGSINFLGYDPQTSHNTPLRCPLPSLHPRSVST